jgi:hypothetical protein
MKSVTYKHCSVGVSWNIDNDSVLLQLTKQVLTDQGCEQVRVRLTPQEAIEIANKIQAVAQMLIGESRN